MILLQLPSYKTRLWHVIVVVLDFILFNVTVYLWLITISKLSPYFLTCHEKIVRDYIEAQPFVEWQLTHVVYWKFPKLLTLCKLQENFGKMEDS